VSKKKQPAPVTPRYPKVFEMYGEPSGIERDAMSRSGPSTTNWITFRRYRVTIEEIAETNGDLLARLKSMWRTDEKNHHHYGTFLAAAKTAGVKDEAEFRVLFPYDEHGCDHRKATP